MRGNEIGKMCLVVVLLLYLGRYLIAFHAFYFLNFSK